ncbi:hypothetical protein HYC85_021585 [Camellia sinensis]|uniref:Uncharacterized protein n=1 Tax=Camellia sinensis TaxID=4442 RepID=A0A7J7GM14_CAMSI|nr:hypothetical protein HYC85_021585 [Camellia sinensis]
MKKNMIEFILESSKSSTILIVSIVVELMKANGNMNRLLTTTKIDESTIISKCYQWNKI